LGAFRGFQDLRIARRKWSSRHPMYSGRVSADLAPLVFSTAGLPAGRRVELWEEHNAAALIGLAVRTERPLEATELNVRLPRLHLARVAGSPHVVERTAGIIRRDPADAIAVYLSVRGRSWFADADRTRPLSPGSVLLCETDRPFARGFADGLEELVVRVPRQACADLAGPGLSKAGLCGARRSEAAPVVTSFDGIGGNLYARALARITRNATRTRQPVPADEGTVLDLVAVLLAGQHAGQGVAHRAAARSYIADHLTDPDLGAAQIASAVGISERQLSRVFASDGTSVPRHILIRRLDLARSLLTGPNPGSVAEIAARCGFTSAAYFSHAFRSRFGERASDVRREARG
jgi:AraC-like DNA-binding protein